MPVLYWTQSTKTMVGFYQSDSFPVPTYLLFKGDEGLRRNDVIVKIAGYAGKHALRIKVRTSLHAMRSRQILLGNDWERVYFISN